jgi:hypothetical protein
MELGKLKSRFFWAALFIKFVDSLFINENLSDDLVFAVADDQGVDP